MSMMKRGIFAGFVALACVAAAPAFADSPIVTDLHVTFITKDNTKGQDPHVSIQVLDDNGKVVADLDADANNPNPNAGSWDKDGVVSVVLNLKSKDIPVSSLSKVKLAVKPDGTDTWDFNYNLSVTSSADNVVWHRWHNQEMGNSKTSLSNSL